MNSCNLRLRSLLLASGVLALCGLSISCQKTPEQKAAAFLQRGNILKEQHDYRRAMLEFRNAIQVKPKDAELYYQVAVCAEEVKEFQIAAAALRKAIEINPKHANAQLALASLERFSPDKDTVEEASSRALEILNATPNDAAALNSLAITEIKQGKLENAEKHLEAALAQCPTCIADAQSLAILKMVRRDLPAAEKVLKDFVNRNPRSAEGLLLLADLYMQTDNRPLARAQAQRAVDADPTNVNGLLLLSKLQSDAGETTQAEVTYKRLSALPNKSAKPLHASFLYQQGKREEAIHELSDLFKQDPTDRTVRGMLVSAYIETGNVRQAEQILADTLKKSPHDTDALLQRSSLLITSGKAEEAIADLTTILHFHPNSAEAHYGMARVAAARHNGTLQRQELGEALKLNPGYLLARLEMSSLLLRRSASDALKLLDDAPANQKTEDGFVLARHEVLLALRQKQDLRTSLNAALKAKQSSRLLFQDAQLRVLEKDYAGARVSLEKVLSQNPENMFALNLLAQTYAEQGQTAEALKIVRQYAGQRTTSPYLLSVLGTWENKAGHVTEAHDAFAAALRTNGQYLPARLALAHLDAATGNLDEARQLLSAVSDKEMTAQVALGLGFVEQKAGNVQSAREKFRKALALEPQNVNALIDLANNLAADKPDEALKYAETAVELAPANAMAQDALGWVYYRKALYDLALKYFKSSVAASQAGFNTYHLSLAYAKLGNADLSRQTMAAAVRLDPTLKNEVAQR